MYITTQALIEFIEDHNHTAVDSQDGTLSATCEAVQNGKVTLETDRIPANKQAVLDWLGY